jgi:DNA gyrase, A subunit
VAVEVVHNDDEVMLISEQGKIIRFNMNDIAVKKGKAISGVKTQNLDEGDKVASIAVIPGAEIEEEVE